MDKYNYLKDNTTTAH